MVLVQTRQRAAMALKHRKKMLIKVTLPRVVALVVDSGDKKGLETDVENKKIIANYIINFLDILYPDFCRNRLFPWLTEFCISSM